MKLDCRGILLLGPTGSGKTPLGEAIERSGVRGCRAVHFDFGAHLRAAVANPEDYPLLSPDDIALLIQKLKENALLDDNEFFIAEKILVSFVKKKNLGRNEYLILNGLPRHAGQAEAVGALIEVERVIFLDCSPDTVQYRISVNEGGDRAIRTDDSPQEIERRLEIFLDRKVPLLDFYRRRKVPIRSVRIEKGMGLEEVMEAIKDIV